MGGSRLVATAIAVLALTAPAAPAASVWSGDGPWGPYGWDQANGRFHQPTLSSRPASPPQPLGAYDDADFDSDGVRNVDDNCLLVANRDQAPAVVAPAVGPVDANQLSAQWKAQHPGARFRDDAELGEACSGYNRNYLRTTRALIRSSHKRKLEVFRYLGESGPMFGGAANPFPAGRPTAPAPQPDSARPQDWGGRLAKGNMTPSMPLCSGYEEYAAFVRWLSGTQRLTLLDALQDGGRALDKQYESRVGCGSDLQRPAWEQAMRHGWAGKRLYTNADGGRITNRFFASITENPLFEAGLALEPFTTLAKRTGAFPFADAGSGQTRYGIIFRGRSYLDGNDAIVMDWRGFEAAWPLGHGGWISGGGGMLIYDECRAIQTGVYDCTAVVDVVIGERRHTFQEGYMPWVVKGPPSIDQYLAAAR